MKRMIGLALLGLVLLGLVLPMSASVRTDGELSGNWKLSTLATTGATELTNWVVTLETKEGKTTAKVLTANPTYKSPEVTSLTRNGDHVRLALKFTSGKASGTVVFEGHLQKDGKKIFGVAIGGPAYMTPTDLKELDPTDMARKLPVEELKSWAEAATKSAKDNNAPWALTLNSQFAEVFFKLKVNDLAVQYAVAAEKALDAKATTDEQVKVLEMLSKALKGADKTAEFNIVAERLAKLDKILDEEYLAKVPSFKGKAFAGRKGQSDRVVVMELFTGAQCPPCVASDVAFDVLQTTYKRSDLVLLQYHEHIPGPDPMTNADTEARWKYYRDASKNVSGTPTAVFAGQAQKSGGGAMGAAEKLYERYCSIVDPLLETPAVCKITASAKRVGNKIQIKTDIAGLEKPGEKVKLRLVLAEENIRYVGSNKLRFHHQVVRAMPGGADGVVVKEATFSATNEVDLKELHKTLTTYLDDYAANKKAFPRTDRPLDFKNLRVVAMIQDDVTHDILQAVQVDVVD